MIEKKFRQLMLDCPDIVRAAVLTDKQIEIAKLVHRLPAPIHSRHVANAMNISVQNAGTQLTKLTAAGYVLRRETLQKSGGMEYEYLPLLNRAPV